METRGNELQKVVQNIVPGKQGIKRSAKIPILKMRCWNIWTLMAGLPEDLQGTSNVQKTAVINSDLKRLNLDIATLQET